MNTMYTTIRQYKMRDPSDIHDITQRAKEGFAPLIRGTPGFVAWYLVHRERDVLMSFAVFEEQSGAEAASERAGHWIREHLGQPLPNPPIVTSGEVVAHCGDLHPELVHLVG